MSKRNEDDGLYDDLDDDVPVGVAKKPRVEGNGTKMQHPSGREDHQKNPQKGPSASATTGTKVAPFLCPESVRSEAEEHKRIVDELQGKVEELTKENDTLRRNISTLYRTAKAELARKDRQIAALGRGVG